VRFAALFGGALVVGHIGQLVWLIAGSRTMPRAAFGSVLAAQALYGVLQYVVDNGSGFHGARLAAAGNLDAAARASIVRLRLQLALPAGALALAIGAVGGRGLFEAMLPFALALPLFALLTHWERFGLGHGGPWSAYLILRGAGPAVAAVLFLAADARLPGFVPGLVECAVIAIVALAFRLRPWRNLLSVRTAAPGPWRSTVEIGLPTMIGQLALAAGTVMLGMFGRASAAAELAVSVRILTGVNQVSGVLATALFPKLARAGAAPEGHTESPRRAVALIFQVMVALVALLNAALLFRTSLVVGVFLKHPSLDAQRTALMTLGAAGASSYLVLVTLVLIARHGERVFLRIFVLGTAVTLAAAAAVTIADPETPALWMAAGLAAGQLLGTVLFAARGAELLPHLRRVLWATAAAAAGFAAAGAAAAAAPGARTELAALELAVGLAALGAVGRGLRRSRSPRR
jgi:O-antigen/teichoic acid export membrane protein